MCGITGVVDFSTANPISPEVLDAMCEGIKHRGPDGTRTMQRPNFSFGHTRLSVIDTETGWQPISNEEDSVHVILNGEVYNFRELRATLESKGHTFKTASDTEVVVHLYEDHGPKFVHQLDGMFAIAIFDERRQKLVLARDRIGKKPLYYSTSNSRLIFGSELKAIKPVLKSSDINYGALRSYLTYGYVGSPESILSEVKQLPPASILEYDEKGLAVSQYWKLDPEINSNITFDEATSLVRNQVDQAVSNRLVSDVPLGFFLSGGLDSSITVASAASGSSASLKTFSIGFEEQSFSELPHARTIADKFSTDHEEFVVTPDLVKDVADIVWAADEPFADSSMVPLYYLSKQTRNHVTVAVSGDGGDETFSGYDRYYGISLAESYYRIPKILRKGVIGPLAGRIKERPGKRSNLRRLKRLAFPAMDSSDEWYCGWMQQFRAETHEDVFTQDFLSAQSASSWTDRNILSFNMAESVGRRARFADLTTYLPGDLMVKADRMSMAFGLEVRSPFLDHHLVELCSTLPEIYLRSGRTGKRILKAAYKDLIPVEISDRPKEGFTVPVAQWINGSLNSVFRERLLQSSSHVSSVVNPKYISKMFDEHAGMKHDHSIRLWNLFCLETWADKFGVGLA